MSHGSDLIPTVNPKGEMAWESSPSRYIAKVSLATGKEILRPIDPDELLVHAHRDKNPLEVTAQFLASRAISWTGNEETVKDGLRKVNLLGLKIAEALGQATGSRSVEKQAKRLIGVSERDVFFKFREAVAPLREGGQGAHREAAEGRARPPQGPRPEPEAPGPPHGRDRLPRQGDPRPGRRSDRRIERVVCVVRPEKVRDPKTKEVVKVLTPKQRGALLLRRIAIAGAKAKKFRLRGRRHREAAASGSRTRSWTRLERTITHVVHCAASVSFDDTYENSFRANVQGARNALDFALSLQARAGLEVHPARRDRDVLHPRAQEAHDRAGVRARLPAELLQQLLRAHEGDGVARDGLHAHREGAARRRSSCPRS